MFDPANNPIDKIKLKEIFSVEFLNVPTGATCSFKAFLTSWDDNFKQDWESYTTVGRMDPIRTYKRTSRILSFALEIPSYDAVNASYNFAQIQKLIQMSYPTFSTSTTTGQPIPNPSSAQSSAAAKVQKARETSVTSPQTGKTDLIKVSHMVSPPFFKIKFANWTKSGLYGTIENVKFSPDFSNGFYSTREESSQELVPALLKLDITFNVLHTDELGYDAVSGKLRTPDFPYNANNIKRKIKVK